MALTVGKARELCELYVGKDINPETFRELLNVKIREFCDKTRVLESYASMDSTDTAEYELPSDCIHVKDVVYDDYRAHKMTHWEIKELAGEV